MLPKHMAFLPIHLWTSASVLFPTPLALRCFGIYLRRSIGVASHHLVAGMFSFSGPLKFDCHS